MLPMGVSNTWRGNSDFTLSTAAVDHGRCNLDLLYHIRYTNDGLIHLGEMSPSQESFMFTVGKLGSWLLWLCVYHVR